MAHPQQGLDGSKVLLVDILILPEFASLTTISPYCDPIRE